MRSVKERAGKLPGWPKVGWRGLRLRLLGWLVQSGGTDDAVRIRIVYREIASNKRRSVIFIALFFVIWLAIGAACGFLFKAVYRPSVNTGAAAVPPTHYG